MEPYLDPLLVEDEDEEDMNSTMDTAESSSERAKQPFPHSSTSSPSETRRRLHSPEPSPIEEEDQVVYMFICFASGPICHSLYALSLSNQGDEIVYPVTELPRSDYAEFMCCQKLGSKLYVLGGFTWEDDDFYPDQLYPEKVYSIDTSTISPSSQNIDPSTLLVECSPMSSGKPNCRAFVVGNFLYAISSSVLDDSEITRFERFDPGSGTWFPLPDPPFNSEVNSDAVVGSRVILGTTNGGVYCFDVNELTWINIGRCFRGPSFRGHSTVLDDVLYSFTHTTVIAFGPTTNEEIDEKVVGMFKKSGVISPHLYETILDNFPPQPSVYLDYWGKRLFCLGIVGTCPGPEGHKYSRDREQGCMSIIIFDVPNQRLGPPPKPGRVPSFEANLLHEASYLFKSRNGADTFSPYLIGCFSNSKIS